MFMNKILKLTILISGLLAASVMAQTPYDEGQKALRDQSWAEAAEQFNKAIQADKANADAAMYWRAHALYQANRKKEAERQIRSLERKYPDSRWLKEAQILQIEHQGTESIAKQTTGENGLDEELRIFALAQLMDRDPQRALPLVLDILQSTESDDIRNDALFVLGMSDTPEAKKAIADIARDSKSPELQANAIHLLGTAATESSLVLLESLYTDEASHTVKQAIIHAHIAAGQPDTLISLLKSEKNPQLQRDMIHALGAMDATSELQVLYPTISDRKSKIAALEAFSITGDSEPLKQVLSSETDPELRKTAIYGIAMDGGKDSAEYLQSLYTDSASKEEKVVILESLVMLDYAEGMAMQIVRTEADPELQRQAIQVLGVMEATKELGELYGSLTDQESRMIVLQSMAIAGDTDGLINIMEVEKDQALRISAIQSLAINGNEESTRYLLKLYPDSSRQVKTAIIESMLIVDDIDALMNLLEQEKDPGLRREMLQMLTTMDSEKSDEYLFELLESKG